MAARISKTRAPLPAKKPIAQKGVQPRKKSGRSEPAVSAVSQKPTVSKKVSTPVSKKATGKGKSSSSGTRYRCGLCGYIYSPLRGEPHNGIPAGTAFDDLSDDYVCPVCGYQGKGKIGKWGFEEWHPTRYLCSVCGYVYDEKRGEPHRGIRPGTKFEDLPEDYICPVCALDPKISIQFGKVFKQGFEALNIT